MDPFFDKSLYQSKEKLEKLLATMSVKQIANYLGVSYKLINVWAIEHKLISRTPDTKVP